MKFLILLLCVGFRSLQAQAVDWQDWQEMKNLAEQGKAPEAILSLRAHPQDSSAYYYNLGTLLLSGSRMGEATAYLEKANRLKPHDPEIQNNLRVARDSLKGVLGAEKVDPASSPLEVIADQVPRDEANGAIGLLALIVGGLWARNYWRHRSIIRTITETTGGMALIGLAFIALLYALLQVSRSQPPAVLIERQQVKSGPGETFALMNQLEAGVKVRVTGIEDQGWSQIRHTKDTLGWIRSSSLLLL